MSRELWIATEDVLCAERLGTGSIGDTQTNVCHPSPMTQSSRKFTPIVNDIVSRLTSIDWAAPCLGPILEDLVEEKMLHIFAFKDMAGEARSEIKRLAWL